MMRKVILPSRCVAPRRIRPCARYGAICVAHMVFRLLIVMKFLRVSISWVKNVRARLKGGLVMIMSASFHVGWLLGCLKSPLLSSGVWVFWGCWRSVWRLVVFSGFRVMVVRVLEAPGV